MPYDSAIPLLDPKNCISYYRDISHPCLLVFTVARELNHVDIQQQMNGQEEWDPYAHWEITQLQRNWSHEIFTEIDGIGKYYTVKSPRCRKLKISCFLSYLDISFNHFVLF